MVTGALNIFLNVFPLSLLRMFIRFHNFLAGILNVGVSQSLVSFTRQLCKKYRIKTNSIWTRLPNGWIACWVHLMLIVGSSGQNHLQQSKSLRVIISCISYKANIYSRCILGSYGLCHSWVSVRFVFYIVFFRQHKDPSLGGSRFLCE